MAPLPPVSTALGLLETLLFTEPGSHKSYPWADMALLSTLTWSFRGFGTPPVGYYPTPQSATDRRTYADRNSAFPPKSG